MRPKLVTKCRVTIKNQLKLEEMLSVFDGCALHHETSKALAFSVGADVGEPKLLYLPKGWMLVVSKYYEYFVDVYITKNHVVRAVKGHHIVDMNRGMLEPVLVGFFQDDELGDILGTGVSYDDCCYITDEGAKIPVGSTLGLSDDGVVYYYPTRSSYPIAPSGGIVDGKWIPRRRLNAVLAGNITDD